MSHLISSCHILALTTNCMGSGTEFPNTSQTWTHMFFKVFIMSLAFRCNPGSPRGENKTVSPLGSPWKASGDVLLVLHGPHISAYIPLEREAWQRHPSCHFLSYLSAYTSGKRRSCLMPLPLLWEHFAGTSAVFVVLWRTSILQHLDLGPGTSGKTNDISCATSTWHKYNVCNVMHSTCGW